MQQNISKRNTTLGGGCKTGIRGGRGGGGGGVWNFLKGVIMYLNSPWDGTETLKDGYISRFAFKSGPLLFDGLFFFFLFSLFL